MTRFFFFITKKNIQRILSPNVLVVQKTDNLNLVLYIKKVTNIRYNNPS